jgi:hypothetical protein
MMTQKVSETLNSRNFFVSLVTLILIGLQGNGIFLDINPDDLTDTILSRDLMGILAVLVVNGLNPILKLLSKAQRWSWDFLRSPNFITQAFTVVLTALAFFGMAIPKSQGGVVSALIRDNDWLLLGAAITVHVGNSAWHFFFDRKQQQELPADE